MGNINDKTSGPELPIEDPIAEGIVVPAEPEEKKEN